MGTTELPFPSHTLVKTLSYNRKVLIRPLTFPCLLHTTNIAPVRWIFNHNQSENRTTVLLLFIMSTKLNNISDWFWQILHIVDNLNDVIISCVFLTLKAWQVVCHLSVTIRHVQHISWRCSSDSVHTSMTILFQPPYFYVFLLG